MIKKHGWLGVVLALGIVSCGGEGSGIAGARNGGGIGETPGGSTGTVVMGSTADGSFQEGTVGIGATNLSSGGSTSLTVQLRDGSGAPYTESVDVTFSSDCQSSGRAEISEPVVTTTIGTATTTYNDLGCPGSDTITARATAGNTLLTATGALTVAEANLGSIEFISADPQVIGLKGTGAAGIRETATVKFRVLNDVGGPMPDQEVIFSLNTAAGGLSLANESAVSGSDGTVSVIVRSGTIPISVRITATVAATDIATQSSALTVSTAIPDNNSFSLSAETYNPEAWLIDGVEVGLSVLAADRFNNLVPDDTAIVFTTELGAIVAQCLTVDGACSATWRSQAPRIDFEGGDSGRTTILAHAIGEESFEDENGNGRFDGSTDCASAPAGEECFHDLPEAWRDDNEDGNRQAPDEDFVDLNTNGIHDSVNGDWNGIVCGEGSCNAELTTVSNQVVLVMARSEPSVLFFDINGNALTGTPQLPTTLTACVAGLDTFVPSAPATLAGLQSGQPMPAGTDIEFSVTVGEIAGRTEWIVPNTNGDAPRCYSYDIQDGESGDLGRFEINITAPSGWETYAYAPVQDSPEVP